MKNETVRVRKCTFGRVLWFRPAFLYRTADTSPNNYIIIKPNVPRILTRISAITLTGTVLFNLVMV